MIKTIKKIDIHGNETWQEVYVCNRCKRTLNKEEFVYTTKWQSCFFIDRVVAVFSKGLLPEVHICEKCSDEVQDFWNGKDIEQKFKSADEEQGDAALVYFRKQSTYYLREFLANRICTKEDAEIIKMVLKERGVLTKK